MSITAEQTSSSMQVDIVDVEKSLFSGEATMMIATGTLGELGILPGHTQLLTKLKPGYVRLQQDNAEDEVFYISGGVLEVQPKVVTILADTVERASDLDEAQAIEAVDKAEKALAGRSTGDFEYAKAVAELAEAAAQIRAIQALRKKK